MLPWSWRIPDSDPRGRGPGNQSKVTKESMTGELCLPSRGADPVTCAAKLHVLFSVGACQFLKAVLDTEGVLDAWKREYVIAWMIEKDIKERGPYSRQGEQTGVNQAQSRWTGRTDTQTAARSGGRGH